VTPVLVAAAGAGGAVLRFVVDHLVQRRRATAFPVGILAVNVTGAFALGVATSAALHHALSPTGLAVGGIGFLGAYTTFSSFSFDTARLLSNGKRAMVVANALLTMGLGLAAAGAGLAVGAALT
jgi:fluoride exporter